MLEIYVMILH